MEVNKVKVFKKLPSKLKVCAYARVSSEKDSMKHSLASQVSYYNDLIGKNPNWEFCGIYADEAISGTKNSREEFQRMIENCKQGKIDMIITKSISRFARNTLTLLETCRKLKDLNVDVFFEEQNLHSTKGEGELILTMLATYAQEEAKSVSENMLWKIKKDFEEGKLWGGDKAYGYLIKDRKLIVNPAEADIVRRAFDLYLQGWGDHLIAKQFNKEGIPTHEGGPWKKQTIRTILHNRNYTGDLVLQKTFRNNFMEKKTIHNKGEKNFYLVEDDHEALVSKETFEAAMALRKLKEKTTPGGKKEKVHHPFDGLLVCDHCGKTYRFKKGPYQDCYMCRTFAEMGKQYCPSKQIPDRVLKKVIAGLLGDKEFSEESIRKLITKIVVKDNNLLDVYKVNGTVSTIHWEDPKRAEGWTEAMKEVARQRTLEMYRRRKENGKSNNYSSKHQQNCSIKIQFN